MKGPAFRIRAAETRDADAACRVLRASIEQLCVADHGNDPETLTRWLANKTPDNVTSWIEAPELTVLVAEKDRDILGVGAVAANGTVLLNYVSPRMRFQGVSKAMLGAMEDHLRTQGLDRCTLESSQTAHRFYRDAGYRDTGAPQMSGVRRSQHMVKAL